MFDHQHAPNVEIDFEKKEVVFDGKFFPWFIERGSITVEDGPVPSVTLTVIADTVRVKDETGVQAFESEDR